MCIYIYVMMIDAYDDAFEYEKKCIYMYTLVLVLSYKVRAARPVVDGARLVPSRLIVLRPQLHEQRIRDGPQPVPVHGLIDVAGAIIDAAPFGVRGLGIGFGRVPRRQSQLLLARDRRPCSGEGGVARSAQRDRNLKKYINRHIFKYAQRWTRSIF
jgi:hypothetical protein